MNVWLVSSCGWPTKGSGGGAAAAEAGEAVVPGAAAGRGVAGFLARSTTPFSLPPMLLKIE